MDGAEHDGERIEQVAERWVRQGLAPLEEAYLRAGLRAAITAARTRALPGRGPALYLNTLELKLRLPARVCTLAIVAAVRVAGDGARTLVDLEVGHSADRAFWQGFLQTLAARGLADLPLTVLGDYARLRELVQ